MFPISERKTPIEILNFLASLWVLILLSIFWVSGNHSSLPPAFFLVWLPLQLAMATITLHVAELNVTETCKQKHLILSYGLWEQLVRLCFRLHSWGGSVPFVSHLPTALSMLAEACCSHGKCRGNKWKYSTSLKVSFRWLMFTSTHAPMAKTSSVALPKVKR